MASNILLGKMSCFLFLLVGIFLGIKIFGIKSQLLVLDDVTIFDKIATWNEAKDICEKRGQLMLTLDSEEKFSVLTNRTSFVGLDLLSGDYWLGLHDVNAGSSREFYWHDCRPFLPLDWSHWDPVGDEPDNPSTQRCIRIFYGKWRTVECHIARRFICEAQKDYCPYLHQPETAVEQSPSTFIIELNSDLESCKQVCNNMYAVNGSCWGVMTLDSESSPSSCKLVITNDVPNTHTSSGVNLYMKDCLKVSVNNDSTTVQSRPDVYPVSNCSLAGQKINAGILPTSLRCSAHVVLNSSDLTSSYPITSTHRITTTEFKDVSHEDLILSIQNMKNSLAVNKSETSSEIRKKISVYESRTSAVSMGLIGTIVIVLVILCPVISDLTSVIQRRKK